MLIRTFIVILLFLALSGCASVTREPMPAQHVRQVREYVPKQIHPVKPAAPIEVEFHRKGR